MAWMASHPSQRTSRREFNGKVVERYPVDGDGGERQTNLQNFWTWFLWIKWILNLSIMLDLLSS